MNNVVTYEVLLTENSNGANFLMNNRYVNGVLSEEFSQCILPNHFINPSRVLFNSDYNANTLEIHTECFFELIISLD